ncbi:hypothetical protein [Sphingopyxis sp. 113P3]|jgi:Protein of unknown function (DUF3618).|uniref:hypothetical protein n=1 Tax=Sphingopyxis sp. (strain 113P3) TaxID=292913 RepID=UPI0006AD46FF|nr:hypothetical protein [Sphingopyxis sp. 113P3]ALC11828.1 hypothetical protein LH20_07670 [Sphingopyxis sp. 113P3]
MRPSRARLINAARRSMIQRAELRRKLQVAGDALKPGSLLDRGKYRVGEKVDDAAHMVREQFRENRLPIALAAMAGIAWLFREPLKEHVPRLGRKVRDLAEGAFAHLQPSPSENQAADEAESLVEEDDEAPQ